MFKSLIFCQALLATVVLTGCVSAPRYEIALPEPRPSATEPSYAMQVATAFQNNLRCLGCKDTYLWQNEKHLISKARFNSHAVTRHEYDEADEYMKMLRKSKDKASLPPPPKVVLNRMDNHQAQQKKNSGGFTNGFMLADSFDGRWTNPGSSLGAGLALGLLLSSSPMTDDEENQKYPSSDFLKVAIVLPKNIPFDKFRPKNMTADEIESENATAYAAQEFVRLMTKSAVDLGFKPVGDVKFYVNEFARKPYWERAYQLLENDAIGCPKITAESERHDVCHITFSRLGKPGSLNDKYNRFLKQPVPKILGGDDKKEHWIAYMGYRPKERFGLILEEAKNLTKTQEDMNHQLAIGLQNHLASNQFVFVPSYKLTDGIKTTQCVLDNKGTHYFSVVVPKQQPAPVAPVKPLTKTLGEKKTDIGDPTDH